MTKGFFISNKLPYRNVAIVDIPDSDDRYKANALIGKDVIFMLSKKKKLKGKVLKRHGQKGNVICGFFSELPHILIGKQIEVLS